MKQSYLVLDEQWNIAVDVSAQVEETGRNDAIDPESSRDRRSTWIQMRGKQKPTSPKPREIDDVIQLAPIEAKCTTGTECRFKANCSLKLPLAESCLWSAKKSVGSKVAFPVSRTNVEFRSDEANESFGLGTSVLVLVWWTNVGVSFGVGTLCWGLGCCPA